MFGGDIDITSKPGKGSSFHITFPVQPVQSYNLDEEVKIKIDQFDELEPLKARIRGSHVVVVEDLTYN
jgi:hypothetical protein